MVLALDHIHIYAADPDVSIAFYETYFDAECVGSLPTLDERRNHFLILGAQIIVISAFPSGVSARESPGVHDGASKAGFGVSHIGLNVARLDAHVGRLKTANVRVHGEPVTSGPIRYVYVDAPDGVVLELTQYVLPRRFTPALALLNAMNRSVHASKKTIARTLFRLVG
ncbi:MAG: catechol 2,3-dioxygenase-like lactoylglutathione lyase family enzyme [Polyangiales bacterium]|jgi:catechol 2,3-dioxygenase-like lactoylglutathione lyase family enzyme